MIFHSYVSLPEGTNNGIASSHFLGVGVLIHTRMVSEPGITSYNPEIGASSGNLYLAGLSVPSLQRKHQSVSMEKT